MKTRKDAMSWSKEKEMMEIAKVQSPRRNEDSKTKQEQNDLQNKRRQSESHP